MLTWFKKKHLQQHEDMCQINPIIQISFKRSCVNNTIFIHTMLEGTTQVIIEAIKLACNRVQHSYRYLEFGNAQVALLQFLEEITRRFSKFSKLIRHCILQKIHQQVQTIKANRQTAILTTQDLDQALTCCVKMVQQISYIQEMKN